MKNLKLFSFRFNDLSNSDAASLITQTCEYAGKVNGNLGEMANASLTELMTNAAGFSAQVNRPRKSKYSDQVAEDRKASADLFSEINRAVVYESKSRDAAKKQAALDFELFFHPYSALPKGPIGTQMEQTSEMIKKYKADPALMSAAKLIGVDVLIDELETDNAELKAAYETRTADSGKHEASSTDLRPAATESYMQFCSIIEQAVNLTPNESIVALFNYMDELRRKHSALIQKPKDKGTTPTA
ncbi:MAG: DUF6261 family protein [Paludibacter sp.]|nr:DUF6261 family protein [Paludibacter sp.]